MIFDNMIDFIKGFDKNNNKTRLTNTKCRSADCLVRKARIDGIQFCQPIVFSFCLKMNRNF